MKRIIAARDSQIPRERELLAFQAARRFIYTQRIVHVCLEYLPDKLFFFFADNQATRRRKKTKKQKKKTWKNAENGDTMVVLPRRSIFRVNTGSLLHSERPRRRVIPRFLRPSLVWPRADFVDSANSSFRLSKIRRTRNIRDFTRWYRATEDFTSSAFLPRPRNSTVLLVRC